MSNILIIKHGSFGDIIQANGAIEDIKNFYKDSKVLLLTTSPYTELMSQCPYVDGVIIDKRLPRWNLFYLSALKKLLARYNFTHVFDLQNSSRTKFYKKYILKNSIWSSTETILENDQSKSDFDKEPVLERMEIQLKKSGINTKNIHKPNLSWALVDINRVVKQHTSNDYILIFPFCSKKHINKKWPLFKELVKEIKQTYNNKYSVLIAPGPGEIKEANTFNAKVVLENEKPINFNKLITLINKSKYIISNDTGPAHVSSHLNKKGLVLFGSHTTPEKVSIENDNFRAIKALKISDIKVINVIKEVKKYLD
jgi:ADP-heptose:LPS heptosyltransferase